MKTAHFRRTLHAIEAHTDWFRQATFWPRRAFLIRMEELTPTYWRAHYWLY